MIWRFRNASNNNFSNTNNSNNNASNTNNSNKIVIKVILILIK